MSRSFTTVCIATCGLVFGSLAIAQVRTPSSSRPIGGWKTTQPVPATSAVKSTNTSPTVQSAFYQSTDGLPAFPGANVLPATNDPMVTPPVYPAPQDVAPPTGNLRDIADQGFARDGANAPAQLPQFGPSGTQLPSYQQPSYQQPSTRQLDNQQFGAAQGYGQPNFRNDYVGGTPVNPFQTASTGNQIRAVQNQGNQQRTNAVAPVGFGPTTNQQPPTETGLPFVTPPPARYGRYPTSPYNSALFRNVSYQTVAQPLANTADIANTQPVLPQNVSTYQSAGPCAPIGAVPTYPAPGAVPGTYVPPTITPNLTPGLYSPNNSGYSPVFSLGQENYNVQLGRGIIGQPTVYVPGQPIRNFLRYISP
jgi:hypothetical protein